MKANETDQSAEDEAAHDGREREGIEGTPAPNEEKSHAASQHCRVRVWGKLTGKCQAPRPKLWGSDSIWGMGVKEWG